MILMPSNHSSPPVHFFAGRYPGRIAWLIGPSAVRKTKIREWIPVALDNDAFASYASERPWDLEAWRSMIQWSRMLKQKPMWALVPDVVADKEATLAKWEMHAQEVIHAGIKTAFAVQDGMEPKDVPSNADVVFVGGSTEWKWRTVTTWCESFPRVHVGRVNGIRRLWQCERIGVESVDGTGWFRDSDEGQRIDDIERWLKGDMTGAESHGEFIFQ